MDFVLKMAGDLLSGMKWSQRKHGASLSWVEEVAAHCRLARS